MLHFRIFLYASFHIVFEFLTYLPIFLEALRYKYNIAESRYDDFFHKLVRSKLVDFLIDERKRASKDNLISSTQS